MLNLWMKYNFNLEYGGIRAMSNSKYCKWFCVEYIDKGRWLFESRCGEKREVSRNAKFFKYIYRDDNTNPCPNCGKIITVGMLMD